MKLLLVFVVPSISFAASRASLFGTQNEGKLAVSLQDVHGCIESAVKFLNGPEIKDQAIERAMDHCAISKKVDDANFVCPHYRDILHAAFRREPTDRLYSAETFCNVAETYVSQLRFASKIPNMGAGMGFNFKVSQECTPIVRASLVPQTSLAAKSAPDFWYALCMNQDCAHFLPSRTRWCTKNHQPTHSSSVCEAVRLFAHDEVQVIGNKQLQPEDICEMYGEFVESSHIDVDAYMHVVHGKLHEVPVPEDSKRALGSARMKHDAKKHGIRDAAGQPVKRNDSSLLEVKSTTVLTMPSLMFLILSLCSFLTSYA